MNDQPFCEDYYVPLKTRLALDPKFQAAVDRFWKEADKVILDARELSEDCRNRLINIQNPRLRERATRY